MDIQKINETYQPLLGKKCWHANIAYGTMIILDFGKETEFKGEKTNKTLKAGEWAISTWTSDWQLLKNGKEIASSFGTLEEMKSGIKILNNEKIEGIKIGQNDLSADITFSQKYKIENSRIKRQGIRRMESIYTRKNYLFWAQNKNKCRIAAKHI